MILPVTVACHGCHTFRRAGLDPVTGRTQLQPHKGRRGGQCVMPDGGPWVILLDPRKGN